jgi:hypothetical protein
MISLLKYWVSLMLTISGALSYAQWYEVYTYSYNTGVYRDIEVTNDGKVFVVSSDTIHRSDDYGDTWSIDDSWGNGGRKIQFVSEDTGYVCCGLADEYEENYLMTIDGGLNWMPCGNDINLGINDIEYLPDEVVVAATRFFPTWVTVGAYCFSYIWQDSLATAGEVYDLDVLNDSVMFMCGAIDPPDPFAYSTTIKSVDGGNNWQVSGDGYDVPYYGMDWPTDSVGYGNGLTDLYKTVDQGETWFKLPNPFEDSEHVYLFATPEFVSDEIGYVTAGRYPIGQSSDVESLGVLRTNDGGMSWYITDTPDGYDGAWDIICMNADTCYYRSMGKIFRTFNGGGIGVPLTVAVQQTLSLTLHPNPATTSLIIEGLSAYPNATMTTVTLSGQQVAVAFENGQANIAHLPPGIYLTTVQTEQGLWREKWVKL